MAIDQMVEVSLYSGYFDPTFFASYIRYSVEFNLYPAGFQKFTTTAPTNIVSTNQLRSRRWADVWDGRQGNVSCRACLWGPLHMMESWHGNAFRIVDPLWGEPPVTGGFTSQRDSKADFLCFVFFNKLSNKRVHIIGPPSHWSPISLAPHLIGPPSHWSPISLIPQLAPMHHSFHWSPISLVPHLIGPLLSGPQFISPRLHYLNSLVPLLIGPLFHKSTHFGQSQWSPISLVPHLIGSPISLVPSDRLVTLVTLSTLFSLAPHLIGPPM